MADINEILGRNINSIKELKAAMNELKDSLIGVDASSEEYKATSEKLAAAQEELNKVTRAGKADNDAAADSIRGLEQQYKALYDQYKMLTEEQRNSDFGKNMASSLEEMSNKINDAKKEVGNFTSNIGRYAQGATEAFGKMGVSLGALQTPMKLAAGGAKTLGASLKALIANPVGAVIMAIVVAMKALHAIAERVKKAINDNEESSNRLKVAMATFKPIVDAVSNAFDFLAKIVVKVVEGLAKVAEKIMSVIPGMKQAIQSHKDLAKATNELTKATREANVENSKKKAEIERLREEASATDDVIEKRQKLEEAKELQRQIDEQNVALAQEELRIMEEYAAKTANSAEENEKLAAAQKKVNDAIAQGEANMRMYNKQISATETKTKSAGSAAVDYRKKAKELYEQIVEDSKTEIQKLTEKYEKEKKLLEKYHLDTKLLTKKYNKDLEKLVSDAYKEKKTTRQSEYQRELEDEARHRQNVEKIEKDSLSRAQKNIKEKQDAIATLMGEFNKLKNDENLGGLFNKIFEEGNYDMVGNLEYAMKLMPELKDKLTELGEEGFDNLSISVQHAAARLENVFGIVAKNKKDLQDNLNIIDKEIDELFELTSTKFIESANKTFEKAALDSSIKYYEQLVEGVKDTMDQDEFNAVFEDNMAKASEIFKKALLAEYDYLNLQKQNYENVLTNDELSYDARIQLMQEYEGVLEKLHEKEAAYYDLNKQRTAEMVESLTDMCDKMAGALSTYRSSQESLIDSEVKAGKIDEAEARKKKKRLNELQKVQNAFSIATIVADAASGIFSVWKGYAMEVGTINPQTAAAAGIGGGVALAALNTKSLISAIAKTAGLAATATAQISALHAGRVASDNNLAAEAGGGSSVSVGATPALIDSTPYTYTRTVQTTEEEDQMNRPIYVTVTDIEDGLGQRAKVTNESSF